MGLLALPPFVDSVATSAAQQGFRATVLSVVRLGVSISQPKDNR